MALSWNEIKKRAVEFSKEYANATKENAETQSFYNDFFNVFGISRRRVASFEEPVKKLGDKHGRIDLFWKGMLLVEQKSAGLDLSKAKQQALDYFPNLKEYDLPKYILVSDFQNFELYDLEEKTEIKFPLKDLLKYITKFGFIAGYTKRKFQDQEPVNIKAGELMGELHDRLVENGYLGHELEQFLIRLLFCLFADDTGIFEEPDRFKFYIEERTKEDGSDLGGHIANIFQALDTPKNKRQKNIDEELNNFPYINGSLFEGQLPIVQFDSAMREQLIKCCSFDWSQISPAIFGAMFQSATDQKKRRNLGAHYTSEKNIMKIIKPLFLDELNERFNAISQPAKLKELHDYIAKLKFLDPACGCGNFLIIAYRELRELELKIIKKLYGKQAVLDVAALVKVNIDQFYGIEIEELPAKIAEVAMWLVDHQMNMKLSEELGLYFVRIPLTNINNIIHANALRMQWDDLVKPTELNYILGNPPFLGKAMQDKEQKLDMEKVFAGVDGAGVLDFVTCWYIKAAKFIQNTRIKVAFVSTNSISQGEQVSILWNELFYNYGIKIHFAHRTFAWSNEARGKAAVFCVIVGFAASDADKKLIYEYDTPKSEPHEVTVKNINPYLVSGGDIVITSRTKPLSDIPEIKFGSMPNDGGNLLLAPAQKNSLVAKNSKIKKFIKPLIGAREFLNAEKKFCIWLKGANPSEMSEIAELKEIIAKVREYRLKSDRPSTKKLAETPSLFGEIRQPNSDYVVIPRVSSENRKYIPIGFFSPENIVGDTCLCIPNATLYHFGILTSLMHNDWMRYTAGRLKSDYRYSNKLVYNNFPFPKNPSASQTKAIEEKAQAVLDARAKYPDSSLADLYSPLTMPPELVKAHNELDKAVDAAYGKRIFKDERERIEFLFILYQEYTAPLLTKEKKKRGKK